MNTMFTIHVKRGTAAHQVSDLLVILHPHKTPFASNRILAQVNTLFNSKLFELLQEDHFLGKSLEAVVVPSFGRLPSKKVLCLGMGDRAKLGLDTYRILGAQIYKRAAALKAKTLAIEWPSVVARDEATAEQAEAFFEGLWLASYTFHTFKGTLHEMRSKEASVLEQVTIMTKDHAEKNAIQRGIEEANILSEATMFARTLVNTPSGHMTPQDLAEVAKKVAGASKYISLEILSPEKMQALGMEAALAVGRGSDHPPVGVHLIYRSKGKAKKRVALIGKAVTFDSGGLSIKPADGMMTMKIDMAGAAAVLGVFQALPALNLQGEVHGIFLAVENMPSGKAYRPGDVVKAMNGVTIEVLNTDAEGRVTLADALSYANTFVPDVIIDLATLTGACVVALGDELSGLMTTDEKLAEQLLKAAHTAGEGLWRLPLHAPYGELIKSKVADIKNIGGRSGGAITAGLFLQHFVGKTSWAHLDIAGPAYAEKETRPDLPFGATGYGVRTLLRYLQSIG